MDRIEDINKISRAIAESRKRFDNFLSTLGWDEESLEDDEERVNCPVNSEHTVPNSMYDQHVHKCRLKHEGIDPKDVCPSSHFFYKNSLAVVPVIIDKKKYESFKESKPTVKCEEETISSIVKDKKNNIETSEQPAQDPGEIPLTVSASISDLNVSQRKDMYDHVIQTAKAIKRQAKEELDELGNIAENTDSKDDKDGPKSHLETIAEMRDYKRRRQSYRAKNVHMTKRSSVEVMRDLIETQMKLFQEQREAMDDE